MRKFEIEIFKYADDSNPDLGQWSITAWGRNCKTPEEVVELAKKIASDRKLLLSDPANKDNKYGKFSRVRVVEVIDEFYAEFYALPGK